MKPNPVSVAALAIIGNASAWSRTEDRMTVDSRNDTSLEFRAEMNQDGTVIGVVVFGVMLSIFILTAIVGNILVIVAIITERNLRRAGNNFLISLAVADALVACLVMTFAAANDLTDRWSFGTVFCIFWQSSDVMCCTASILNICAVSFDRYIHIRDPLRYRNLVTHRRSLFVVTVIWMTSAVLSFLPITLGWHRLGKTTTTTWQNETRSSPDNAYSSAAAAAAAAAAAVAPEVMPNSSRQFFESESTLNDSDDSTCYLDLNPWYACISSTISFYIPCVVMLVIYIRLYRLSLKHRKFMTSIKAAGSDSQRTHSPKFPSLEIVGGDGCTLTQERDHQPDTELCHDRTLEQRNEIPRAVSKGCFEFQTVPVVTISRCSSVFNGNGHDFSARRCSDVSDGTGSEGVKGSRRLLGTELQSQSRSSTNSVRTTSHRPSIISGSLVRQTDHKAAITVGCIIGIFLFCWGPFFIINIIGSVWEGSIPPFAFVFFTWLGYINSCANPIIYGITNVEFRRAFVRILTSRCFTCCRCRLLRRPVTGRQQEWNENNNCYRQVRTNDSPLLVYGIN